MNWHSAFRFSSAFREPGRRRSGYILRYIANRYSLKYYERVQRLYAALSAPFGAWSHHTFTQRRVADRITPKRRLPLLAGVK